MILKTILTFVIVLLLTSSVFFLGECLFNFITDWMKLNEKLDRKRSSGYAAGTLWDLLIASLSIMPLFCLFYFIKIFQQWYFLPIFIVISGNFFTLVEFLTGILLNKILKFGVYDYSHIRFNLLGQTTLYHYIAWNVLGGILYLLFQCVIFISL